VAVLPPSVVIKRSRSGGGCAGALRWRGVGEHAINAIGVVILSELSQLPRKIHRIPEEHLIKARAPEHADQAFNGGVRDRGIRNRFDLLDREYAQVGEPAVETEQRVVVGTDVFRSGPARDGMIDSIDIGRSCTQLRACSSGQ